MRDQKLIEQYADDSNKLNVKRKNRRKVIRTVMQFVILALLLFVLFNQLIEWKHYKQPEVAIEQREEGFIAVSYFGVSRSGTTELISKKQLREQLEALKRHGYTTISQQNILDYYEQGKALPAKALYLAFEDGRNDSSLFAQPILEKQNYKATMLTYANKMGNGDSKFLQPKQLKKMMKSGFWELGTNGYRLAYINIATKDGKHIPFQEQKEFIGAKQTTYYTHYLNDFIRDEYGLPAENRQQMEERINTDYEWLASIYTEKLGFIPPVYMLMHANTLYNGMNSLVEAANEQHINRLFMMHFNREGTMVNNVHNELFDLTRVQPQAFWQTNHLLMKLQHDTKEKVQFLQGNREQAAAWLVADGAAEFQEERQRIALTTRPGEEVTATLLPSSTADNYKISTTLAGHLAGEQSIYMRVSEDRQQFIRVSMRNGQLIVEQTNDTESAENMESVLEVLASVSLYSEEDIVSPDYKSVQLDITLQGTELSVIANGEPIVTSITIANHLTKGNISLAAKAILTNEQLDPIYDGVFEQLIVKGLGVAGEETELMFSNLLAGWRKGWLQVKDWSNLTLDWVMEHF